MHCLKSLRCPSRVWSVRFKRPDRPRSCRLRRIRVARTLELISSAGSGKEGSTRRWVRCESCELTGHHQLFRRYTDAGACVQTRDATVVAHLVPSGYEFAVPGASCMPKPARLSICWPLMAPELRRQGGSPTRRCHEGPSCVFASASIINFTHIALVADGTEATFLPRPDVHSTSLVSRKKTRSRSRDGRRCF